MVWEWAISVAVIPDHSIPHVTLGLLGRRGIVGWIGTILLIAISATEEELVFRCYLITRLQELLGDSGSAVLVSVVAFGSAHIFRGLEGVVSASVIGLLFAVVFVRTRSVVPLVAAHALHNLWLSAAMISLGM